MALTFVAKHIRRITATCAGLVGMQKRHSANVRVLCGAVILSICHGPIVRAALGLHASSSTLLAAVPPTAIEYMGVCETSNSIDAEGIPLPQTLHPLSVLACQRGKNEACSKRQMREYSRLTNGD